MRYLTTLFICIIIGVSANAQVKVERSSEIVSVGGWRYYLHKVTKKQTLYSIAKGYNVSEASIIAVNPGAARGLRAKQDLLVPTQATFKNFSQKKLEEQLVEQNVNEENDLTELEVIGDSIKIEIADIDPTAQRNTIVKIGPTKDFNRLETIKVAIILPFNSNSDRNSNYVEFLNGVLIAIDDLKSKGISTDVKLISFGEWNASNNSYSSADAAEIIGSGDLDNVNLIIGPVLQSDFKPFADWATENHVPIVSPLASIGDVESPYVFQATPTEATRFDKLKPLFNDPQSNLIVMKTSSGVDDSILNEMRRVMPDNVYVMENVSPENLRLLSGTLEVDKENVIVLPVLNEGIVTGIAEKINQLNTGSRYRITLVGLARWSRFSNINIENFFKLNTIYVSNYHEDRTNEIMHNFYVKYISNYHNLPSVFSMRGYDVTLMFISSLAKWGPRMPMEIGNFDDRLLQVRYHFEQESDTSSFLNREWVIVNYSTNYSIIVK